MIASPETSGYHQETGVSMELKTLIARHRKFVEARHWGPFHSPRNLATALSVEASELLEIFQWLGKGEDGSNLTKEERVHLSEEMADVLAYLLRLSDVTGIDLEKAYLRKMKLNAKKYPVRLSKGKSTKYDRLKPTTKVRKSMKKG